MSGIELRQEHDTNKFRAGNISYVGRRTERQPGSTTIRRALFCGRHDKVSFVDVIESI
jgi:hypothetical protein